MKELDSKRGYTFFVSITIVAIVATIILIILLSSYEVEISGITIDVGYYIPYIFAGILIGLIRKGELLQSANDTDWVIVLFFGKPLFLAEPGPIFIFPGLFQLEKITRQIVMEEFPGDSDSVFYGDEKEEFKEGMVRALRIPVGLPSIIDVSDEEKEKLKDEPLFKNSYPIPVQVKVSYKIEMPIWFRVNVGSLESAKIRMRDTIAGALAEEFIKRSIVHIMRDMEIINKVLEIKMNVLINDEFNPDNPEQIKFGPGAWGVKVLEVQLLPINLTHGVSSSMASIATAEFTKRATDIDSEAAKKKLILEGQGKAEAAKEMLIAEAEGKEKMYKIDKENLPALAQALGIDPRDIMGMEMLKRTVEKASYNMVTAEGLSNLFGITTAIAKTIKETEKTKEK